MSEAFGSNPAPHSLEAEQAALGCVLISEMSFDEMIAILRPEDFYLHTHQWVWQSFERLRLRDEPIDLMTVTEDLVRNGKLEEVGGVSYLAQLINVVPNSMNAAAYGRVVRSDSSRRQLLEQAVQLAKAAYQAEPEAAALAAVEKIKALTLANQPSKIHSVNAALNEWFEEIVEHFRSGKIAGMTFGWGDVDRMTHGAARKELTALAGRPSMGKTSFAAQSSVAQARSGLRVGVFCLEGSKAGWMEAAVLSRLGIDKDNMAEDDLTRIISVTEEYAQLPMAFYEEGRSSMLQVERAAHRMADELGGLDVMWVDHLGYVDHEANARSNSLPYLIGLSTKSMARIAKEMDAALIALIQLSRVSAILKAEPQLTDMRDSGSIEEDSRKVLMLHRPGYYADSDARPAPNMPQEARVFVRKHHNGPTGVVKMAFIENCRRFAQTTDY